MAGAFAAFAWTFGTVEGLHFGSLFAFRLFGDFDFFLADVFDIFRFVLGDKARLDADGGTAGALARIAALGAFQFKGSGGEALLGIERDLHTVLGFDARQFAAFLVEDVERHFVGDLDRDGGGPVLLAFLFQAAQHAQGGGFGGAHQACARAMRAGDRGTGNDAGAQALA